MVCVEQSDALVRAYHDEDEEDLPALEEVAGQKCALVIAPTVQGFHVCVVTPAGEEAYWEELNAAQWQDQADTLELVVLFLWNAGLLPECTAYVENNMSLIHAAMICSVLENLGCSTYSEAPHRPGMRITPQMMEQYGADADNYVRGWARAMAAQL
jgi:hypothetical protein